MRVLHVISSLPKAAGTSVFCVEVCDGLRDVGVECCIAVRHTVSGDYPPQRGVPVFDVKGNWTNLAVTPDVVHIHALWDPFLHRAVSWARGRQIPIVWSPHGMLAPWAMRHKRLKKIFPWYLYQKWDLMRAVMLHATSEMEAGWIRDLGFTQKLVIASLGTHLPPSFQLRQHALKTILFVGRIYPVKGLVNLITAWSLLPTEIRSEWSIRLVGPDQAGHMGELKQLADRLGVLQEIHFLGPLFGAQLDYAYQDADVFVLPSFTENFGGVVVDAMSYGLPVITTKGTPWSELQGMGESELSAISRGCESSTVNGAVRGITNFQKLNAPNALNQLNALKAGNGRCGWWVDIGVEPLVEALREAMSLSDEERRAMGENGQRLVEAKYTWPAIAEQMKAAYAWILNGGDVPPSVMLE